MNSRVLMGAYIFAVVMFGACETYGCTGSAPVANLSVDSYVCVGCSLTFNACGSQDPDACPPGGCTGCPLITCQSCGVSQLRNGIRMYCWNFGDGSPVYCEDPGDAIAYHAYTSAGPYTVTLTVWDHDLCAGRGPDKSGTCTRLVIAVKVDKVVELGTDDEGPLYVVCPGDTLTLQAKPLPTGYSFPIEEPSWTIVSQPGIAYVWPKWGTTTTLYWVAERGTYVVKAQCGAADTGDTIDVITPPPSVYSMDFFPGDPSPIYDDCGNKLAAYDDTRHFCPPHSPFRAFNWWYTPSGASGGTRVGLCVWEGGVNQFRVRLTIKQLYGKERFVDTFHCTQNDAVGPDKQGEGCTGYWCWRVERYDCVANTHQGIWWRRREAHLGPGTRETQGELCPGSPGIHTCYPN